MRIVLYRMTKGKSSEKGNFYKYDKYFTWFGVVQMSKWAYNLRYILSINHSISGVRASVLAAVAEPRDRQQQRPLHAHTHTALTQQVRNSIVEQGTTQIQKETQHKASYQ